MQTIFFADKEGKLGFFSKSLKEILTVGISYTPKKTSKRNIENGSRFAIRANGRFSSKEEKSLFAKK